MTHEGEDTAGFQLAEGARGSRRAPGARRARVSVFPGLLQARYRHHAPHTVVRRRKVADHLVPTTRSEFTQYGRSPRLWYRPAFPLAPATPAHVARASCWRSGRAPTSPPTTWRSSARASGDPHLMQGASARGVRADELVDSSAPRSDPHYQKFLATGITRSLVAAKARKASTRTIGDIFVQLMLTIVNPIGGIDRPCARRADEPRMDGSVARVLESSGVQYVRNAEIEEILCDTDGSPASSAPAREAHRGAWRPLCGRVAARGHRPHGEQPPGGSRSDARQPARTGREPGVDERRAVLSAPRGAVDARACGSHRHRMGAHEHLAAPVLAQRAFRAVRRQRRARHPWSISPTGRSRVETDPGHAVLA